MHLVKEAFPRLQLDVQTSIPKDITIILLIKLSHYYLVCQQGSDRSEQVKRAKVAEVLESLAPAHGLPNVIQVYNGTELSLSLNRRLHSEITCP